MKRVYAYLERMAEEIARKTARFGARVDLDLSILDRSDSLALSKPGVRSANTSCELIKAQDGWIAANLPREDDRASVPALIGDHVEGDVWEALRTRAKTILCGDLVSRAEDLGLAVAKLGETPPPIPLCTPQNYEARTPRRKTLRVVDFSSLWAGPLCGSIFAAMGADVLKLESADRPDQTPLAVRLLDQRLSGAKRKKQIKLLAPESLIELQKTIAESDVLITNARARALEPLGLTKERLFVANPNLIWIAITGHGYDSARIAFGDDAAASGGLVAWEGDEPRFMGDALADPLTGLSAANAALDALEQSGSLFIDMALARTAAYVAAFHP